MSVRILIALVLGLIGGLVISVTGLGANTLPQLIEPIGTLWVNAIRMTVVPLLLALVVTAIAGEHGQRSVAAVGGSAVALFVAMVAAAAVFGVLVSPPLVNLLRIDAAAAQAARMGVEVPAAANMPPFRNWLVELIPTNPFRAAADGAILPLIVFATAFGFALKNIQDAERELVVRFFRAVRDAMYVLIGWILLVGPIGVFALVLALTARMGAAAIGAFSGFIAISCALLIVGIVGLYVMVALFSRVGVRRFARAAAPAQVVAFSTRSSLATLPALITAAARLGLPGHVTDLVLPVAVSIFKFGSPLVRVFSTLFIAELYGIDISPAELVVIAAAFTALPFYSPGIPSGGLLVMTPVYLALGLPVEGIAILIALDAIPDMFLTAANITADLAVAAVVARGEPVLAESHAA
jgi:Na+/H+-dicarboxylate symporter